MLNLFLATFVGLWLAICGVWVYLLVMQLRAARAGLLPSDHELASMSEAQPAGDWPTVCIVIPAHNEGGQLSDCLASVLTQDYPALTIVVVDDRSVDDTLETARRFSETDSRLHVRRIDTLPDGWLGKSHALWRGTDEIDAEWILFLDADCLLKPLAIRRAIQEAGRREADFLTLWPAIRAETFWENLVIPLCAGIIALWYDATSVNDPDSAPAFANGQLILIRTSQYRRIGGHREVRRAIIEDIPFAELAKRNGVRCHVASGRGLFSVRMYSNYHSIRDGWARIYVGALRSSLKIMVSLAWLALGSLLPYAALVPLFVPGLMPDGVAHGHAAATTWLRACCGSHLLLMLIVSYRFWGFGGCDRRYLALYPLAVVAVMRILCRSWWWITIKRAIPWKTTIYRIDGRGAILD